MNLFKNFWFYVSLVLFFCSVILISLILQNGTPAYQGNNIPENPPGTEITDNTAVACAEKYSQARADTPASFVTSENPDLGITFSYPSYWDLVENGTTVSLSVQADLKITRLQESQPIKYYQRPGDSTEPVIDLELLSTKYLTLLCTGVLLHSFKDNATGQYLFMAEIPDFNVLVTYGPAVGREIPDSVTGFIASLYTNSGKLPTLVAHSLRIEDVDLAAHGFRLSFLLPAVMYITEENNREYPALSYFVIKDAEGSSYFKFRYYGYGHSPVETKYNLANARMLFTQDDSGRQENIVSNAIFINTLNGYIYIEPSNNAVAFGKIADGIFSGTYKEIVLGSKNGEDNIMEIIPVCNLNSEQCQSILRTFIDTASVL